MNELEQRLLMDSKMFWITMNHNLNEQKANG